MNQPALRVILIGGTSNVGKSTLAQSLSSTLGWQCVSTDTLARHPGRPWGQVKDHVAEHYLSLAPDELLADVLRHYASMWPDLRTRITTADRLVLEGSALWPESVAELKLHDVAAIWLTASDRFLQERIDHGSEFERASSRGREMIEKFVSRTQLYNERMMQAVHRLGLPWLDVEQTSSIDDLREAALCRLAPLAAPP